MEELIYEPRKKEQSLSVFSWRYLSGNEAADRSRCRAIIQWRVDGRYVGVICLSRPVSRYAAVRCV